MSDLISRQAAVDIVLEYAKRLREPIGTPEDNEMYAFGRGLLIGIERNLKQLPQLWGEDGGDGMKGLFIPGITAEMFRSGCLESIEALMSEGKIFDIEADWAWIPVSERLPKKEGEVLVTTSWGNVCMAWCDNGKWRAEYINGYDDDEILAWMPLPEPYMVESEDKK